MNHSPRCAAAAALIGPAFAVQAPRAGAAQLETLVVDVAAQSPYPTYRAPPLVVDFVGANGVGLPFNGLPVGGLPGIERGATSFTGPWLDSASVTGTGDSSFGLWSGAGSSSANAAYGRVGAAGAGTMAGFSDGNTVVGFEAAALFSDSFTVADPLPKGQRGIAVLHFGVDGSLSVSGSSGAAVYANYRQGDGPVFTLKSATIQGGSSTFYGGLGSGASGYVVTPTSIGGSGVFDTQPLELTFGSAFDLTFGVFAYAIPRRGGADSSFGSTAPLTGIDIFDQFGQRVDDFTIASASGTRYGGHGVEVAAVPEPTTTALLGTGLAAMLAAWRKRRPR